MGSRLTKFASKNHHFDLSVFSMKKGAFKEAFGRLLKIACNCMSVDIKSIDIDQDLVPVKA